MLEFVSFQSLRWGVEPGWMEWMVEDLANFFYTIHLHILARNIPDWLRTLLTLQTLHTLPEHFPYLLFYSIFS